MTTQSKKTLKFLTYGLLLLTVAVLAYRRGRNDVWVAEFKVYQGNLVGFTSFHSQHSADLKEFLKGRYYYLANRVPMGWLGSPYDYGPVSTNVADLGIGKGDTGARWEYQMFKGKKVNFQDAASQTQASETAANPQTGANGRQSFGSETNQVSAAAASRRSL